MSPRFGLAWDVQGDGKTAVKFGSGKYVRAMTAPVSPRPTTRTSTTPTRARGDDLDGDDFADRGPGCVAGQAMTVGCEIGAPQNQNFGVKTSRSPAAGLPRQYQVESNGQVQRELMPGTSVTFSYFRRDYKNLSGRTTCCRPKRDYTPYDVPDPRNNGQTVPIYNLNRSKLGLVDQPRPALSDNNRVFTGYDMTFNSRFRGVTVFGGVTLGKQIVNTCQVQDPNQLRFCNMEDPTTSRSRRRSS